ncbi:unnamed protein product [Caenorhabditis sp. 36 PRJEB53466]|nr:unnamed protein product [Caenorhabditis sp. 36 PRJEB53466]
MSITGARWLLLVWSLNLKFVQTSPGDRSIWHAQCTEKCMSKFQCPGQFGTFDWVMGDCFWCRYDCMWETVELFESNYGIVPQFHGKWPFLAIPLPYGLVIQEPASLLFSLLNLFSVFLMLRRLKKIRDLPNRKMWILYAHVGLVAWISSSLFHMADCDITEKLDYFGAFAFVLSALYVSFVFTLPQLEFTAKGRLVLKAAPFIFIIIFLNHVKNMNNHFDYGYNMTLCISFSLITTCLYLYYLFQRKRLHGELLQSDILLIRLIVWANLSTGLELLDFAPVFWVFDSHSLFHLATFPIPVWWADFLEQTYHSPVLQRSVLKIA